MAIIKAINSRASLGKAINYVTKKEKTEEKLISGKDCSPYTAIDEMKATKELWGKTDGRQYKHYVQSFIPRDKVTPEQAHEIGKKFIESTEKFKGHEVLMATHVDKNHIHNHFIVNSVNFENGKKYQEKNQELQMLKKISNQLSREHGLTVPPIRGETVTSYNQKKYKAIEKGFAGKSDIYIVNTAKDVSNSLKTATSREEFIKSMESKGYQVRWTKNITFTNSDGKKVRNTNLEKTFKEQKFSKEGMENEIQRNRQRTEQRATTKAPGDRNNSNVDSAAVRDNDQSKRDKLSERTSNGVAGEIQRKIRAIKDRTDRATGQSKPEDRPTPTVQRNSEPKPRETARDPKPKVRERGFDLER